MVAREQSFLSHLLDKESTVKNIGAETGGNVSPAVQEVDRQVRQAARGNPITGEGVTKSDKIKPSTVTPEKENTSIK